MHSNFDPDAAPLDLHPELVDPLPDPLDHLIDVEVLASNQKTVEAAVRIRAILAAVGNPVVRHVRNPSLFSERSLDWLRRPRA